MRVIVNGDPAEFAGATTVATIVERQSADSRGVAVALNGEVVPKSDWKDTPLSENDRLEVLAARGGG